MALNINGTTGISGVDGTVSAPALTGTDSNTGITFPSADTIKFSTGGVERMQITNSGVSGTGISAGKILQVVHGSTTTTFTTTSATLADIGVSASITPSSSSNKVFVFGNIGGIETSGDNYGQGALLRDSTTIIADLDRGIGFTGDSTRQFTNAPFFILDSPNSTSSITYKLQFRIPAGGGTITTQTNSSPSTITLFEVAA